MSFFTKTYDINQLTHVLELTLYRSWVLVFKLQTIFSALKEVELNEFKHNHEIL
jgi:hypothetical protein